MFYFVDTIISMLLRTELIEKYKTFEDLIATDCDGLERNAAAASELNSTVMKMVNRGVLID